ncbi:MAG TPA: maleylpyruvate isomerase family mycothiol-dependent enzyme [Acidimicrobiia bacterium]|jgi:uncharacterized protein (TIGR03083 family)|nr:maleylpyruvate isomerase family mycothiol-dependent enzyme [Acidimicrobiia bacterium]
MDTSEYLSGVVDNVLRFIKAARQAGLDTTVPTCPDWKVSDLALHQGRVFRWMSALVENESEEFIHPKSLGDPEEDEDPLVWLKTNAEMAVEVFDEANPDAMVWNWFDNRAAPARFWYRRMAHEITIHRADAEAAAGLESRVEPAELASDGIDEFLHFLPGRSKDPKFITPSGSYHFHTTDVPGEWLVNFHAQGVAIRREHAKADVAVRGTASDLELFLYNRRGSEGLEVFGDEAMVEAWTGKIRF